MIDVSIVVPVYNVEPYIDEALQSILGQTYHNFELILVDDGSTDASGRICDALALHDPRIKVIHQRNEGVGCARNAGMKAASGEYIYFCDPDDLLDRDLIKDNLLLARMHDADIVEFGYRMVLRLENGRKEQDIGQVLPGLNGVYTYPEFLENFREECRLGYMLVCRLYKRRYLIENGLLQTNMRVGEDAVFVYETYRHPFSKLLANQRAYYTYIRRKGTATTKYDPMRFTYESIIAHRFEQTVASFGFSDGRYEDLIDRKYVVGFNLAAANLMQAETGLRDKLTVLKQEAQDERIQTAFRRIKLSTFSVKSTKIKVLLLKKKQYRLVLWLGMCKKWIEQR